MSESEHTEGSWRLEKQFPGQLGTAIGGPVAKIGGEELCESVEFIVGTTSDWGPHGEKETEANARLVAASPDLLAVLREVKADIEAYAADHDTSNPTDVTVCLSRLQFAIDKATKGR